LPIAVIHERLDVMEDCFVYVLGCAGANRYLTYVGWTLDVDRRLAQHNAGTGARSTRGRVWVLIHCERYATRQEAMSREWHLKRDRAFRRSLVAAAKANIQKPHSGAGMEPVQVPG
jgi:putative endonuclease